MGIPNFDQERRDERHGMKNEVYGPFIYSVRISVNFEKKLHNLDTNDPSLINTLTQMVPPSLILLY